MAKKNSKLYTNIIIERYFSINDVIPERFKEVKVFILTME